MRGLLGLLSRAHTPTHTHQPGFALSKNPHVRSIDGHRYRVEKSSSGMAMARPVFTTPWRACVLDVEESPQVTKGCCLEGFKYFKSTKYITLYLLLKPHYNPWHILIHTLLQCFAWIIFWKGPLDRPSPSQTFGTFPPAGMVAATEACSENPASSTNCMVTSHACEALRSNSNYIQMTSSLFWPNSPNCVQQQWTYDRKQKELLPLDIYSDNM